MSSKCKTLLSFILLFIDLFIHFIFNFSNFFLSILFRALEIMISHKNIVFYLQDQWFSFIYLLYSPKILIKLLMINKIMNRLQWIGLKIV